MESTADYSNNLSNYLLFNAYRVGIINPIQTHALRKTRIRDAKNDKIDSMIICRAYKNIKTMRSRDITLFSSPSKVLAYAGLDPKVYQSGNFKVSTTRMSKRGSGMLRWA